MKIEKLTKDNIKEFIRDLNLDNYNIEKDINKYDYYGVKEEDIFYMSFIVLSEEDCIAIKNISKKLSDDKFLEFIEYLNNSLVSKTHLIIRIYDDKYMKILGRNYKCKDMFISLEREEVDTNLKEKYAEVDMYNIRYLYSKKDIVCNLIRQNIQDISIINRLHDYFVMLDTDNVSFIIYEDLYELLEGLGYKSIYKSYIINDI